MATNQSGLNPYGYVDTGTGAFPNPPVEEVYGAELDVEPTGLVDGPPAEVTVESPPEHLEKPTGASPNPPPSVTYTQAPAEPEAEPQAQQTKPKAVKASEIEDKTVKSSTKKRSG